MSVKTFTYDKPLGWEEFIFQRYVNVGIRDPSYIQIVWSRKNNTFYDKVQPSNSLLTHNF